MLISSSASSSLERKFTVVLASSPVKVQALPVELLPNEGKGGRRVAPQPAGVEDLEAEVYDGIRRDFADSEDAWDALVRRPLRARPATSADAARQVRWPRPDLVCDSSVALSLWPPLSCLLQPL